MTRHAKRQLRARLAVFRQAESIAPALSYAMMKHPAPWKNRAHAVCVLLEEVCEVVLAVVKGDGDNLKTELAQVAAVVVRWLEWEARR